MTLTLALLMFAISGSQSAPVVEVSVAEAERHLQSAPRPHYPLLAESARVQGMVGLRVRIGIDGRVEAAIVARSIPIFDQEAIDVVRRWRYRPFTANGQAVVVHADVDVTFFLKEPGKELDAFLERERVCRGLIAAQKLAEAEGPCAAATNLAGELQPSHERARADMYLLYGELQLRRNNASGALAPFKAAAQIYGEKWTASADAGVAERALAAAYLAAGDSNNARRSLERAESLLRKAQGAVRQIHAPNPETQALRSGLMAAANDQLRKALSDLVAVLRKSGKSADADKAEQRLKACCQ